MRSRSRRSPPASPAPRTCACRWSRRSRWRTTAATGPAGHASEEAFSPYLPGTGYDHAVYGADVTLAPLNLCAETLDGVRNHSWRRPAPATPEGEVVAWADRIAYVCHDFEDAVRAGILEPDDLPRRGRRSSSARPSEQIGVFVLAVLDAIDPDGHVGMTEPGSRGAGRVPRLQLRADLSPPGGTAPGRSGSSALLGGLVDYFADAPRRHARPCATARSRRPCAGSPRRRAGRPLRERDDRPLRARARRGAARLASRRPPSGV